MLVLQIKVGGHGSLLLRVMHNIQKYGVSNGIYTRFYSFRPTRCEAQVFFLLLNLGSGVL